MRIWLRVRRAPEARGGPKDATPHRAVEQQPEQRAVRGAIVRASVPERISKFCRTGGSCLGPSARAMGGLSSPRLDSVRMQRVACRTGSGYEQLGSIRVTGSRCVVEVS